jgi:hypothetical protein
MTKTFASRSSRPILPSHRYQSKNLSRGSPDVAEEAQNVEIDNVGRVKWHESINVLHLHGLGSTVKQRYNLGLRRNHCIPHSGNPNEAPTRRPGPLT